MSEPAPRLFWIMDARVSCPELGGCIEQCGPEDAILLVAAAVCLCRQAAFEKWTAGHHVYVSRPDWHLLSGNRALPESVQALDWTGVILLVEQYTLHQTWP